MALVLGCASALLLTVAVSPAAAYPVTSRSQRLSKRELRQIVALVRSHRHGARPRGHLIRATAHTSIVGGSDADPSSWGFTALMVHRDASSDGFSDYCSGTLISPNVVLTAAHCVTDESTGKPLDASGLTVVTGSVDLLDTADQQVSAVTQVAVDPNYDPSDYFGDAALLVLSTPSSAPWIRLASPEETALYTPETAAMIAGWGIPYYGGDQSVLLEAAPTTVRGYDYCSRHNDWYQDTWHPWDTWETCAVDAYFSTGTCKGDSGGPLVTTEANGELVEIGVTSVGPISCDYSNNDTADYFVRTDAFSTWANNVVTFVSQHSETSSTTSSSSSSTTTSTTSTTTSSSATSSSATSSSATTSTTSTTSTSTKTTPASTQARAPKPTKPTLTLPMLTMSDARSYAAAMVHARTHKRPHLTLSCSPTSKWTVGCSIHWRSGSYAYAMSGRFFHYLYGSHGYWWYEFAGTRSWRSCRIRHARRICTASVQRLRWA